MRERYQMLLRHLETSGPDEWHRVALSWNWGSDLSILHWIVAQPQCDAATAQLLFALGQPFDYFELGPRENVQYGIAGFDLMADIAARWKAGQYVRQEIKSSSDALQSTDWDDYAGYESEFDADDFPLRVDRRMFERFAGREVTANDYEEGFPPALMADIRRLGL